MNPWDNPKYQKIVQVTTDQGCLMVQFANSDQVFESFARLNPTIDLTKQQEITNKDLKFNAYEITVRYQEEEIIIPWDVIRFHTDVAFAKYNLDKNEEQNRQIGQLLCLMREQRGITIAEMAVMTGHSPSRIRIMEEGRSDIPFGTLRKYLQILGKSLRDLAEMTEAK